LLLLLLLLLHFFCGVFEVHSPRNAQKHGFKTNRFKTNRFWVVLPIFL
jgi:hypothetical protein